jgi:microcystin-dependent protein
MQRDSSGVMTPLLGTITQFAGNFEPQGWLFCNGQLLSIRDNTPLYAILGNTYGGDGKTTFALPDMRGRVCVHVGPDNPLGETGGGGTAQPGSGPIPPFLAMNWIIAIEGEFPQRRS